MVSTRSSLWPGSNPISVLTLLSLMTTTLAYVPPSPYSYHLSDPHSPQYFNAFSGLFSAQTLNALQSNKDVEYIAEDAIFTTQTITRSDAPWGLERVSGPNQLTFTDPGQLIYSHTYDESAGEGVDIYILDTVSHLNRF